MSQQLSEQENVRRDALQRLIELGIEPFPAEEFQVNVTAKGILENYKEGESDYKDISIAGRVMSKRIMGKASFAELQDASGRIQIYFNRDKNVRTTRFEMVTKKAINCIKAKYPALAKNLRSDNRTARILFKSHTLVKFEITPNSNNPLWSRQLCTANGR